MSAYYCIVNVPGVPMREIAVIGAGSDAAAVEELNLMTRLWPGFETIALYDGERTVDVLVNPVFGFAGEPLALALDRRSAIQSQGRDE